MKKFRKTYIEIINTCNLSCPFCPQNKRVPRMMSAVEFEHALNQLAPYTSLLHFHVLGEPLLHPLIGHFLDLCDKKQIRVHIVTNGTLLNKCIINLHNKDALRSVSISLQSMCATASFEEFSDYLTSLINAIETFQESASPLFTFRLWNKGSESGKITYSDAIREIERHFNINSLVESLNLQRGCMLRPNISINTAEHFEWPHINDTSSENTTGYCLGLKEQIGVLTDGTVIPCCLDHEGIINLGNLFTTPLQTILASDRTQTIKKSFQKNMIAEELCKQCSYRKRFDRDSSD